MSAVGYVGGDPRKVDVKGYTKGNILAADTTGALQPVSVGVNGTVLTANAAQADGVAWVPSGGGSGAPAVKIWNAGTLSYDVVIGANFYIGGPVNPVVNNGDIWFDTDH